MTNYEKYKTEINKMWKAGHTIAISNGEIKHCNDTECEECDFYGYGNCEIQTQKWLVKEYKERQ